MASALQERVSRLVDWDPVMNLDPAKLLVILVIGLLVLGPERLPRVARQLGSVWREMSRTRDRLVDEFREQVPDLPSSHVVRSFLQDVRVPTQYGVTTDLQEAGPSPLPEGSAEGDQTWEAEQQRSSYARSHWDTNPNDPSMN